VPGRRKNDDQGPAAIAADLSHDARAAEAFSHEFSLKVRNGLSQSRDLGALCEPPRQLFWGSRSSQPNYRIILAIGFMSGFRRKATIIEMVLSGRTTEGVLAASII
jgi:hypothetical protein